MTPRHRGDRQTSPHCRLRIADSRKASGDDEAVISNCMAWRYRPSAPPRAREMQCDETAEAAASFSPSTLLRLTPSEFSPHLLLTSPFSAGLENQQRTSNRLPEYEKPHLRCGTASQDGTRSTESTSVLCAPAPIMLSSCETCSSVRLAKSSSISTLTTLSTMQGLSQPTDIPLV